jgi:hypothetical protein
MRSGMLTIKLWSRSGCSRGPKHPLNPAAHHCSLQEKYNKLSQSRAISPRTLGALLHVLQQAAQGQLGSPSVTIAAYQPLQVPQQVSAPNNTGMAGLHHRAVQSQQSGVHMRPQPTSHAAVGMNKPCRSSRSCLGSNMFMDAPCLFVALLLPQALPIFNGTGAAAAAGAAGARQGTAAAGTAPGAPAHAVSAQGVHPADPFNSPSC